MSMPIASGHQSTILSCLKSSLARAGRFSNVALGMGIGEYSVFSQCRAYISARFGRGSLERFGVPRCHMRKSLIKIAPAGNSTHSERIAGTSAFISRFMGAKCVPPGQISTGPLLQPRGRSYLYVTLAVGICGVSAVAFCSFCLNSKNPAPAAPNTTRRRMTLYTHHFLRNAFVRHPANRISCYFPAADASGTAGDAACFGSRWSCFAGNTMRYS